MKKNKQLTKQIITTYGSSLRPKDLSGKIDDIIKCLQDFKLAGWTHLDYEDEEMDYPYISIYQERLETDEEFQKRLDIEEAYEKAKKNKVVQQRIKQKEDRKKLYEQLKKEFEK